MYANEDWLRMSIVRKWLARYVMVRVMWWLVCNWLAFRAATAKAESDVDQERAPLNAA